MRIIEVAAFENGAHRNQTISGVADVPVGWAVIPDDLTIPDTFPFVGLEVTDSDEESALFVVSMTAGVVPAPAPAPMPELTELEQLRADVDFIAMETGVEL